MIKNKKDYRYQIFVLYVLYVILLIIEQFIHFNLIIFSKEFLISLFVHILSQELLVYIYKN